MLEHGHALVPELHMPSRGRRYLTVRSPRTAPTLSSAANVCGEIGIETPPRSPRASRRGRRADDRHDVLAARQHPGERELRRRAALALGDGARASATSARLCASCRPGSAACRGACRLRPRSPVGDGRRSGSRGRAAHRRRSRCRARGRSAGVSASTSRVQQRVLGLQRGDRDASACARRMVFGARFARARDGAPCPARRAAPSRRRCPRSARSGRRGAVVEVDGLDAEPLQARLAGLRARTRAGR